MSPHEEDEESGFCEACGQMLPLAEMEEEEASEGESATPRTPLTLIAALKQRKMGES